VLRCAALPPMHAHMRPLCAFLNAMCMAADGLRRVVCEEFVRALPSVRGLRMMSRAFALIVFY
jgi:hypothetical protein